MLLDHQADIEHADNLGVNALHNASYNGNLACVSLLLKRGAKVSPIEQNEDTPLHFAAANGHAEVVELLLKVTNI